MLIENVVVLEHIVDKLAGELVQDQDFPLHTSSALHVNVEGISGLPGLVL